MRQEKHFEMWCENNLHSLFVFAYIVVPQLKPKSGVKIFKLVLEGVKLICALR